jgi:hypothetical protein
MALKSTKAWKMELRDDIMTLTRLGLEEVLCPYSLLRFSPSLPHLCAALLILSPLTCPSYSFYAEYDKGSDSGAYDNCHHLEETRVGGCV